MLPTLVNHEWTQLQRDRCSLTPLHPGSFYPIFSTHPFISNSFFAHCIAPRFSSSLKPQLMLLLSPVSPRDAAVTGWSKFTHQTRDHCVSRILSSAHVNSVFIVVVLLKPGEVPKATNLLTFSVKSRVFSFNTASKMLNYHLHSVAKKLGTREGQGSNHWFLLDERRLRTGNC